MNNHRQYEEWLQLSYYDELDKHQHEQLTQHTAACEECRKIQKEMNILHSTLAHRRSSFAQEPVLIDARRTLRLNVMNDANRRSFGGMISSALDALMGSKLRVAAGIASIFICGIGAGYVFFHHFFAAANHSSFASASMVEPGEARIEDLRFTDRNEQAGTVEFSFESVTPVHIRGNINDERVQKILAHAMLNDQNTGTRLRAVSVIGTQADQQPIQLKLHEDVKQALITAMLKDKNLGVRKEALLTLRNYLPDPSIVRAFLSVLQNEKNTGLKIAAINSLDLTNYEQGSVRREILDMLKNKAQSDDNNYIRIKAKTALQEVQP